MKTRVNRTPRLRVIESVQVDVTNQCLWRGNRRIDLRPKDYAVLRYLTERSGQLVTKTALLDAVWPGIVVTEAVLKTGITRLRQALGDDAKTPRYIETVHRLGYRLIAPLPTTQPVPSSKFQVPLPPSTSDSGRVEFSSSQPETWNLKPETPLVGREHELAQLHDWLATAFQGERRLVFIPGEAGIGKTTLVDAFFAQVASDANLWAARGQCVEHYGTGEAYLPVLEAFERLCGAAATDGPLSVLRQHAPLWLMQMPGLIDPAERLVLQRQTAGATRERMVREFARVLEVLTAEKGLVLWIDDLQWSDVSTLTLFDFLARRRESARLLLLGTYRPADILGGEHPLGRLKRELQLHDLCHELTLTLLTEAAVEEYLRRRFGDDIQAIGRELAQLVYQRTEGNPLFMVNVVNDLLAREVIAQHHGQWELHRQRGRGATPASIRQFIEHQVERLSGAEQEILAAASVGGMEFSAAAVAAGLAADIQEVEQRCAALARREQFLQASGTEEWADGVVASRYRFPHALHQEVIYARLTAARRVHLHHRIGMRKEQGYGARAGEIAAELALHFEQGQDYPRAVRYLQETAQTALRRRAPREAIAQLTRALALLATLPDSLERAQRELSLRITLGVPLLMTRGYAAPEVEQTYTRARELCQQLGARPQLFPALHGLWVFHEVRADLPIARALGEEMLALAHSEQSPALLLQAHHVVGETLYLQGELLAAREHLERAIALYDSRQHDALGLLYGLDPGVVSLSYAAWTAGLLGYAEQALTSVQRALTLARQVAFPLSSGVALIAAAIVSQARRDARTAQEQAEAAIALATEQGLPLLLARAAIVRGWALTIQGWGEEGIAQMQQGLSASRAMGAIAGLPYFLALLAEAYEATGQMAEGLQALDEALLLASKNNDCNYEAELYRLKGTLTLQSKTSLEEVSNKSKVSQNKSEDTNPQPPIPNPQAEAEAYFHKALEIARSQSAKFLELRAAVSLSRLWRRQGKLRESRDLLAPVYNWFTEGFDTADLVEAKTLLDELRKS
jgi:DNA-binding winged helix-turn-helix (wHTH) protein/predicted ATPase